MLALSWSDSRGFVLAGHGFGYERHVVLAQLAGYGLLGIDGSSILLFETQGPWSGRLVTQPLGWGYILGMHTPHRFAVRQAQNCYN
jgi:hypothetical protein